MLGFVARKVPFLAKGSAVRILLPQLLKPLARFIPYVGAALLIADIGIPLVKWGFGLLKKLKVVEKPKQQPATNNGGRSAVLYEVHGEIKFAGDIYDRPEIIGKVTSNFRGRNILGPIHGAVVNYGKLNFSGTDKAYQISVNILHADNQSTYIPGSDGFGFTRDGVVQIVSIKREDGQPDTGGNIGSPFNPLITSNSVRRMLPGESPYSDYLPGGNKYQPITADPTPARQPLESNKRKPLATTIPAGKSTTLTTPDGNSVTIAPSSTPRVINIPRPLPRSTPVNEDDPAIAPLPLTITSPNSAPIIFNTPGSGKSTISIPGQEPIVFDPSSNIPATGVQPLPIHKIGSTFEYSPSQQGVTAQPVGRLNPQPTSTTIPTATPSPTTTPSPASPATNDDLEKLLLPLGIFGGLTGLGFLIKQIHDRTAPSAIETAAAAGTCRTTQPGGCSSKMADKNSADIKKKIDDNAAANSADTLLAGDTNVRVRNIENRTGSNEYPMVLPKYLIQDDVERPPVTIPNQVRYNEWLLKQIDALFGQFPIKIEHTDEDGKKAMLTFENLSEAVAEIFGFLSQIAFDADTAVNVGTMATGEAIGAKAAALQAGSYLKAIVDYMGFQGQPVSIDVPISVTPGAVGLDGKLQENELKDFLWKDT